MRNVWSYILHGNHVVIQKDGDAKGGRDPFSASYTVLINGKNLWPREAFLTLEEAEARMRAWCAKNPHSGRQSRRRPGEPAKDNDGHAA